MIERFARLRGISIVLYIQFRKMNARQIPARLVDRKYMRWSTNPSSLVPPPLVV